MKAKSILLLTGGLLLAVVVLVAALLIPVRKASDPEEQTTKVTTDIEETTQEETPMVETKGESMPTKPTISTITFPSTDGVPITADLYWTGDKTAPFILLFHQARYSRGEYMEIAPKLNALGYNCLAIDQRSGDQVNGIKNETNRAAKAANRSTEYVDAYLDLEATLAYVQKQYAPDRLIVWGSSYSSSLVLILASAHPNEIDAVLSFSPGEYFKFDGHLIADYAKKITQPVFITSAKSEEKSWLGIADQITAKGSVFFVPKGSGMHGSSTLLESTTNNAEYWTAVESFLASLGE